MNMLDVYDKTLTTCGYIVDENGHVRKKLGKALPVSMQVNGETRFMVLPTRDNMKSERHLEFVFFHPFQENLMRGESRIMASTRRELNIFYGASLGSLMLDIVDMSAGSVNHTELTTQQREILESIGKVDERFNKDFKRIIENLMRRSSQNTPATLSLRKGVEYKGVKHSRIAVWSSPLFEEVKKTIEQSNKSKDYQPKILGVSVRKSDLKVYENLCNVFFKGLDEKYHYAVGISDATDAPYFEAFIRSLLTLPKKTNEIAEIFFKGEKPVFGEELSKEHYEQSVLDIQWLLDLGKEFTVSDWRSEYLLIPLQDGNEGTSNINEMGETLEEPESSTHSTVQEKPSNTASASSSRWERVTEQAPTARTSTQQQQPARMSSGQNGTLSENQFLRGSQNRNEPPRFQRQNMQQSRPAFDQFGLAPRRPQMQNRNSGLSSHLPGNPQRQQQMRNGWFVERGFSQNNRNNDAYRY